MLEKAIEIAARAHKGQTDKAGEPYILHPLRVMFEVNTELEKICGVLHDVVEDTPLTLTDLRVTFSAEVIRVLDLLTHKSNDSYKKYIDKILTSEVAIRVKKADLKDNMNLSRLSEITESDLKRCKKYHKALRRLEEQEAKYKN